MTVPSMFNNSLQQTAEWFKIMMQEEGIPGERQAYAALRAVLHQLRDRLPAQEVADLGAQLPLLIRGVYYEGWTPGRAPAKVHEDAFIQGVAQKLNGHPEIPPQHAIAATIKVLREKITEGEIQHVLGNLPKDLQQMWHRASASGQQPGAHPS